jgi:hypothetical protein
LRRRPEEALRFAEAMGHERGFGEQERFARAAILVAPFDQVDAGLALDGQIVMAILAALTQILRLIFTVCRSRPFGVLR